MSGPTEWHRIRSCFEQALLLDGEPRATFLARLATTSPDVEIVVRRLLLAHERTSGFLEGTAAEALDGFGALQDVDSLLAPPTRIGRYRIEDRIGEGGMAVVYRAVLDDAGLQRVVALKVSHVATRAAMAEAIVTERDVLARLSHPNIAHLYDGGLTEDGRAYLVMEHVAGQPITVHCAERRLTLKARIRLLQDVCAAVDYAHRNLVVHRDLKPSNVLVTPEGLVKLLDFGVAKVLDPDVMQRGALAARTMPALTPAYAAPEQWRRARITTATDVWGLGVLAYELITGARPHAVEDLSPAAAERMVCNAPPVAPSVVASRRGLRLNVPAAGDLDAVLLKALRVDPAERYATAGAFAEDLQLALAGQPVRARPITAGYRARRFLHRHRTAATLATVVAIALLTTTTMAVQQARSARALALRAETERARSAAATVRAQRINQFLQSVLATANPSWYVSSAEKGPDVTVLRALEMAAARMDRELAEEPETRGDIHHTLADTYRALGRYAEMGRHFDSSLVIRERVFRAPHPKIADAMYYAMIGAWQRGDWDRADSLVRGALEMQRARDEGNNLPYMLETAASFAIARGEYQLGESLARESVAVILARYDSTHIAHVVSEEVLARALLHQGKRDAAASLAERLAAHSRASGRSDAAPLRIYASLAAFDGRHAEADSLFATLISMHSSTTRIDFRLQRVRSALLPSARYTDARHQLDSARTEIDMLPPPLTKWPVVDVEWHALQAKLSLDQGRRDQAAREAQDAVAHANRARGSAKSDPFWRSRVLANEVLAQTELAQGKRNAAVGHWRKTLAELMARDVPEAQRDSIRTKLRELGAGGTPSQPDTASSSSASRK
ncbi:serine/threonine-protein kinase [Gemmatimonas sp. UBA7669]|uniref:serine/threonine-protein kinase n=1 Tax=Gemmatimonas sp. UBA7669 TaxID=1946568 RepID=UPI0025BAE185|nr:serine/threonine-protein kinase [Gemmatimonas sp. UBA7669]